MIDDMTALENAIIRYGFNGADYWGDFGWAPDGTVGNDNAAIPALISGGYLTAKPSLYAEYNLYTLYPCALDADKVENDHCILIDNVPNDICVAFNEHVGIGAPAEPADVGAVSGNDTWFDNTVTQGSKNACFKHPTWGNEVVHIMSRTP